LKKEIIVNLRDVQDNLDCLPPSFSDNPQAKLLGVCDAFFTAIDQHTNGSRKHPKFLQVMHDGFWKLAKEIVATRPSFEIGLGCTSDGASSQEISQIPAIPFLAPPSMETEDILLSKGNRKGTKSGNLRIYNIDIYKPFLSRQCGR
jgi:hypothetical protein